MSVRSSLKFYTSEQNRNAEADLRALLDIATDLSALYKASPPPQKRSLIKNCLVLPSIQAGILHADAANWLVALKAPFDENKDARISTHRAVLDGARELRPDMDKFTAVFPRQSTLRRDNGLTSASKGA